MKTRILATAFLVTMFAATATAQTNTTSMNLDSYNLSEYEDTVNQHTDELPDWIKDLVGDEDVNVYINEGQNDSFNLSIKMDGLKVQNMTDSALDNPKIEVWTSTDVIQNITESEDPVGDMQEAINNGEIRYEANDTWTKVKLFFADLFMGLL